MRVEREKSAEATVKPVILVVDDDPTNLAVVRDSLHDCSYTILLAEDGESAVARARYALPDLILLDVMMPGMDGFDTCLKLKESPETEDIPIIFMTALAETGHKVKGLAVGAVDYITKPFQREELLARVAVHLQIRQLNHMLRVANESLERRVQERTVDLAIANRELEEEIAERQVAQEQLQEQALFLEEKLEELQQAQQALAQSEHKFRAVFDQTYELMGLLSPEGKLLEVNRTALEMAGVEAAEVVGKPFWECPWCVGTELRMRQAVVKAAAGKFVRFETSHRSRDGRLYYIDFSLMPLTDEEGKVLMLIPEGRDISERRAAEIEQLRLVTAVEQIAEAISITDVDFHIEYVNPAFERMNGYALNEIVGQSVAVIRGGADGEELDREIAGTLAEGRTWSGRLTCLRKDGSSYHCEAMASPIRNPQGTVINYVTIHRDITNEMRLEQELRQSQKMEAIGTLAAGIAHDFNNILTAIIGNAEMALAKVLESDPVRRNVKRVLESGSRAADLVKQILTFSRQAEQERKPVQLAEVTKEVLKLVRSSLPATIEIRQQIEVDTSRSVVCADPTQLHQVLMNLCTNAAHAMNQKGGLLRVELTDAFLDEEAAACYQNLNPGRHLKLSVSDTGHGIDRALLGRIFDPYFTTKKPGEGTGMGLAVSMGIVESYGGAITVESEPGRGTVFQVLLPESGEQTEGLLQAVLPAPTGNEHVLLVDDERQVVEMAEEMLTLLGYRVTGGTSPVEILKRFRAEPAVYDLVITDMTMPGLTGRELCREIQQIRPDLPIIICSGYAEFANPDALKEAGVSEFLMKPYATETLAVTVRRVLESSKGAPAVPPPCDYASLSRDSDALAGDPPMSGVMVSSSPVTPDNATV